MDKFKRTKILINNILENKDVRLAISCFGAISKVLSAVNEKKGFWHVMSTGAHAIQEFNDRNYIDVYDYFDHEWQEFLYDISGLAYDILQKYPYVDIKTDQNNHFIRIHDFSGNRLGYVYQGKDPSKQNIPQIHVFKDHYERAKELMYQKIWSKFDTQHVVLTSVNNSKHDESFLNFSFDDSIVSMSSKIAREKADYLRRCMDAGLNRSLLLYGPPGTGKSTIAKTIIHELNLKSFRITLREVNRTVNTTLINDAIKILKPDALIIDDLDRTTTQHELLETIEKFHNVFKVILVTANDISRFDKAMLRPERFDELIFVKSLDEDVVRNVLGQDCEYMFDRVKLWPVSFIKELTNRRRVMTQDEIDKSIHELEARIEENNSSAYEKYDDKDDVDDEYNKEGVETDVDKEIL